MGMLMTWGCNLLQQVGVDNPSQYQYISKLTEARVCFLFEQPLLCVNVLVLFEEI